MNDLFWGEGFTDWTTTRAACPLYKGHAQPLLPSHLGYYDLRELSTIKKQAALAKMNGIDGFAIYHYLFDKDTKALNSPVNIIRNNPEIDIEYFLCWVNVDWTKSWVGDHDTILYKQVYDDETIRELARDACIHFSDNRYYKINNVPIFHIHEPFKIDFKIFKSKFLKYTSSLGFPKILFCAPEIHVHESQLNQIEFITGYPPGDLSFLKLKFHLIYSSLIKSKIISNFEQSFRFFSTFNYPNYVKKYLKNIENKCKVDKYIPTILSGWDNTPRYSYRGYLFNDFNGTEFGQLCEGALHSAKNHNKEFFLIKAWNEWAEGNVMEPSDRYGFSMLENFKNAQNTILG